MKRIDGAPVYAVREIKLSTEKEEKLVKKIQEWIEDSTSYRADQEPRWKLWVDQANSRRVRKDAGPKDSKIDMGITGEYILALKARLLNAIFQHDMIYVTIPRRPEFEDIAKGAELALDYICDRTPLGQMADEWLDYALTLPFGVVKTHWVDEQKRIKKWKEIDPLQDALEGLYESVNHRGKTYVEEWTEVTSRQGCFPEVIPTECFMFDKYAASVDTSEWCAHKTYLTKTDVQARIRDGYWRKKVDGVPTMEALGDPESEQERLIKPYNESGSEEDCAETSKVYEVWEIYTAYEVADGDPVECIFTYVNDSDTLVRAIYNPYHSFQRPFVTWSYKNVHASIEGLPLTYVLEPIHVAYSASVNQRLDAASRANTSIILCRTGSDVKKAFEDGVRDVVVDIADDPNDVKQFFISQPWTQLPDLEDKFLSHADKRVGMSDYLRGLEMADRPTASGQTQLIEEAKQQLYMLLESFRKSFALVGMHMLARYRQFYPAGLELYMENMNPKPEEMIFLEWPAEPFEESIFIETKVSSATMNKQLRKQEMVAFVDKIPQMYSTMMQLAQQAVTPSPIAMTAQKLLMGYQLAVDKFMTEFEISKKEYLNPQLSGDIQIGQYIAQMAQQVQMLSQQNAQLQQQLQMLAGSLQGGPAPPRLPGPTGQAPQLQGPPVPPGGPQG